MKRCFSIIAMSALACLLCAAGLSIPSAYTQPEDNGVRDIRVTAVHDGDTVTADILMGTLGRTLFWAHGVRLRLKGVRAYEIMDDAAKQAPEERRIAITERDALSAALNATNAAPLRAKLFHQTFDRYEAVIYTAKLNANELMLTYPQGGR